MKLTKDNFKIIDPFWIKIRIPLGQNDADTINQILKNQEDAEKLEIACDDAAMQLMKRQEAEAIVERLKKRIEELKISVKKYPDTEDWDNPHFESDLAELQKILGE